MLLFLKIRPLNYNVAIAITIINEVCAGVAIFSALMIGIYDNMADNFSAQKIVAGWLIIFSYMVLLFAALFLAFSKFLCKSANCLLRNRKLIGNKFQLVWNGLKSMKKNPSKTKILFHDKY